MTQNYRRMGLVSRLNAVTGGTEKFAESAEIQDKDALAVLGGMPLQNNKKYSSGSKQQKVDPLSISTPTDSSAIVSEVQVERDNDGNIVRIVRTTMTRNGKIRKQRNNPLNDPLVELDSDYTDDEEQQQNEDKKETGEEEKEWGGIEDDKPTEVVKALEAEAANAAPPRPRKQSQREVEWLTRLIEKHGDDTEAMAKDLKLNVMQQTEVDIARRLRKWKVRGGGQDSNAWETTFRDGERARLLAKDRNLPRYEQIHSFHGIGIFVYIIIYSAAKHPWTLPGKYKML